MHAKHTALLGGATAHGEEAFQKLLLQFSAAAASSGARDRLALLPLFCRGAREFFEVDGAYFWRAVPGGGLVGMEADGWMAADFRGRRLETTQSTLASDALREKKTIYVNHPEPSRFPLAAEFRAESIMAVPVIVSNEPVGVVVLLHQSDQDFFNDDLSAKATILAGQFGSLLEASRRTGEVLEEQRRAEILAEAAHALHEVPDPSAVVEALADRLRILLRTRLVCVLLRDEQGFCLKAVAADSPKLATSVRNGSDNEALRFAIDLAAHTAAAGEPIAVDIAETAETFGGLVPAGTLIAAPLRTSNTEGAVLVYPRRSGPFTPEEKSLLSAVSGFGAVAIANAELYRVAREQALELHQLLEISAELRSIGHLDEFMEHFVIRAAGFLGFGRAFIGLLEDGRFQVRWLSERGQAGPTNVVLPVGTVTRTLLGKEPFWSDDPAKVAGIDLDMIEHFHIHQLLAVPLLGSDGEVLGMFGVIDRIAGPGISKEDVRRARALGGQVAIALDAMRNLHLSEQHRHRADSLIELALVLSSLLRLPEFAREFFDRAVDISGATGGALVMKYETGFETEVLQGGSQDAINDCSLRRQLANSISRAVIQHTQTVVSLRANDVFGPSLASVLGWKDCTLLRLQASSRELAGVLCLANRKKQTGRQDEQFLQAVGGHASVALENARLFSRMEQANRHWIDIFDAITDFIVVHDQSDNVLRVNRSLADFIGVLPQQLIGVRMGAVLALGKDPPLPSCPFCTTSDGTSGEYVDPVLERTYLVSTSRVHAASSEGLQTIHVMKDITDRREAEQRYRELFDNIQEGLFFCTPEGRFIEVNDALVRMLGYSSREELLNEDLREHIFHSVQQHQELVSRMQLYGVVRNHEETLRHRDGSIVHVLINAFAVKDRHDRAVQFRGVMLDISGIKNFQAELQRERDFSGKILNNTQSLILVADASGLISYANRRWYDLGYEHDQLLGQPLEGLVAPARRQALTNAFRAILAGKQVDNLELLILRGDGKIGQFSGNLSPMWDEQGRVASLVVVMTDVTDAAMLQAKLLHAEKMAAVGQLVSGVAHEVNNPLTAILGFTDLLMEDPSVPESARRDLRVVLQEAQRTKQIVQNLLSFARQMPPQRKPVQLNPVLRRTIQLRAYDMHNRGVEVVENLDETLPLVIGDSQQLQQVFLNILNNAYDAVQEVSSGARIEIATAKLGEFIEASFCDNGHGVSEPERIFDPFFTTKEVGKGTGLGLSICYGIVHEHGGEILCHNNEGGRGATFIVRLPAVPEETPLGGAVGAAKQ